jgi:hypothetical protein
MKMAGVIILKQKPKCVEEPENVKKLKELLNAKGLSSEAVLDKGKWAVSFETKMEEKQSRLARNLNPTTSPVPKYLNLLIETFYLSLFIFLSTSIYPPGLSEQEMRKIADAKVAGWNVLFPKKPALAEMEKVDERSFHAPFSNVIQQRLSSSIDFFFHFFEGQEASLQVKVAAFQPEEGAVQIHRPFEISIALLARVVDVQSMRCFHLFVSFYQAQVVIC